jgi:hypothetical protein
VSRTVRMLLASALGALGLGVLAGPASAGIWSEIPSGTSAEITAIEYQSDTRFWFTTSTGEIWKRRADLSGFDNVRPANFVGLNDIEFQNGGDIGLAVGKNGTVLRSTNGGANWFPVTGITVSNLGDGSGNKCTIATPLGEVNFVRFAGNNRVWIGAQDRQIATSQPATAADVGATGTWIDANRKVPPVAGDNCWITQGEGFADMFITPNPAVFFIGTGAYDEAVYSANNLMGTPQTRPAEIANGFVLSGSMAGDPANPDRMWAVSGAPYGNSTAQYTEDGYQTSHWFHVVNESSHDFPNYGAYDVDYAGGTVLTAGNAGYILHSTNGRDFYWNGADGALATQDWRAVGLASANRGAVGGLNGKLVITNQANVTPDIVKPTGTISGPSSVTARRAATFTLNAADEGGSGLNPSSYNWSTAGLPNQSGQTVAFTFPNTGSATITVTFADNAGNVATATRFVTIAKAPATGGGSNLPVSFTGRGNSLTAKIVGNRVRIRARGTIKLPAGAPRSACSGKIKLTVKRKRTTLAKRSAKLKRKNGKCRFGKTIFIRRSKVGRSTTRLRLKVSFRGNAVLKAGSTTKTLVIKR